MNQLGVDGKIARLWSPGKQMIAFASRRNVEGYFDKQMIKAETFAET